jgi:hypothetical protein
MTLFVARIRGEGNAAQEQGDCTSQHPSAVSRLDGHVRSHFLSLFVWPAILRDSAVMPFRDELASTIRRQRQTF